VSILVYIRFLSDEEYLIEIKRDMGQSKTRQQPYNKQTAKLVQDHRTAFNNEQNSHCTASSLRPPMNERGIHSSTILKAINNHPTKTANDKGIRPETGTQVCRSVLSVLFNTFLLSVVPYLSN
jgi:hypothetical protein